MPLAAGVAAGIHDTNDFLDRGLVDYFQELGRHFAGETLKLLVEKTNVLFTIAVLVDQQTYEREYVVDLAFGVRDSSEQNGLIGAEIVGNAAVVGHFAVVATLEQIGCIQGGTE